MFATYILLVCVSLLGPIATAAAQAQPFEPSTRSARWLALHKKYVEEVQQLQGTDLEVLMYGDSITEFARGTSVGKPCCSAYHSVWQHVIGERYRSTIFAASGDYSPNLLWRIQNGELGGLQPRVAVLLVGTNDLGVAAACQFSTTWPRCSEQDGNLTLTAERTAATIEQTVDHLLQATTATRVLLQAVLPRGLVPRGTTWHTSFTLPNIFTAPVALLNQRLQEIAASRPRVHYADCGADFIARGGQSLVEAFMPDALHPSPAGGVFMYQCIAQAIQPLLQPADTMAASGGVA